MPGNFDPVLTIDGSGRILPSGPLEPVKGEEVTKLYAWVFQFNPDRTGASCIAAQDDPTRLAGTAWTTRADAMHDGRFREGPALGMAVTISTGPGGETRVYWWSETIYLEAERPAGGATFLASSTKMATVGKG